MVKIVSLWILRVIHIRTDAKLIEMSIPLFPNEAKVAAYQNFANQIKEYLNKQVDVGVLCEGDPLFLALSLQSETY